MTGERGEASVVININTINIDSGRVMARTEAPVRPDTERETRTREPDPETETQAPRRDPPTTKPAPAITPERNVLTFQDLLGRPYQITEQQKPTMTAINRLARTMWQAVADAEGMEATDLDPLGSYSDKLKKVALGARAVGLGKIAIANEVVNTYAYSGIRNQDEVIERRAETFYKALRGSVSPREIPLSRLAA